MHYVNTILRILQTIVILEWISFYEITAYVQNPNDRMHRAYAVRRVMPSVKQKHQTGSKISHSPIRRWHKSPHQHYHQPQHKHHHLPKRRSHQPMIEKYINIQYYSEFSEWSSCDVFCKKKRERECLYPVFCENKKQIEEKPCDPKYCKPLQMQILGYDYYDHELEMAKKKKNQYYNHMKDIQYHIEDDEEEMPIQIEEEHHHHHYYGGDKGHFDGQFGSSNRHEYKVQKPSHLFEPIPVKEDQNEDEYAFLASKEKLKKQNAFGINIDGFSDQKFLDSSSEASSNQIQQAHLANIVNSYQSLHTTTTTTEMPSFSVFENKFTDINKPYFDYYKTVSTTNSSSSWRPTLSTVLPNRPNRPRAKMINNHTFYRGPMPQSRRKRKGHRFKREAIFDDKEIDEDYEYDQFNNTEAEKKYPGEDMLKIGNAGRKKSREKAVFEVPKKYENHYTKWSRWSKCTAKCTTRRFKRCKIKTVCGNDIIREIAYCYTEGSFCEEWIGNQMRGGNNAIPDPKPIKPVKNVIASRRSDMSNSISSGGYYKKGGAIQAEYRAQNFQCGIPSVRNKAGRSMYHMLRIIGGKTARKGQWPWQVVILNRFKEAFCGGTLVSPYWILTAAHCVRKRLYVRLGEHNLQQNDGTEIEYRIESSIKHPKYDKKTVDNDVAMLRLPEEMEISNFVGFACLPERYQQLPIGQTCTIIGWGKKRHSDDAGTNILHEAEVPIITNDECRNVYHDYTITKNMFCAGHKRGRIDTCAGDSGGPLLCKDNSRANNPWTIFGITSFGDGCGKKNKFGIYTKLPNYVDWIWSVINCNGNCRS